MTIVAAALRGRTCGSFALALLPKVAASCKSWMATVQADDVRSARPEAHTMEERSLQSMVDIGPPIPAGPRHRRQRGRGTRSFVRRTRGQCAQVWGQNSPKNDATERLTNGLSSELFRLPRAVTASTRGGEVRPHALRQKSPMNRCRYGGDMMIEDVNRCSRGERQVEDTSLQSGVAPVGGTLGNSQFDADQENTCNRCTKWPTWAQISFHLDVCASLLPSHATAIRTG